MKGKTNARKRLFFVNDDLDAEQAEQHRCYKELLKEKKEGKINMGVKYKRNRLIVDNMIMRPKVKPPSESDILRLTDAEREELQHVK